MMKMTFVFDNNKLRQSGKSADEIIAPMRSHYNYFSFLSALK